MEERLEKEMEEQTCREFPRGKLRGGVCSGGRNGAPRGEATGEGEVAVTQTCSATYLSLDVNIVNTIPDGDCGLDVMCLMIGWIRRKQTRETLRSEIAAVAR